MELNNYISAEQKQVLSANQVQAFNILSFTNQELENFMVNEYLENPMLGHLEHKENEIITSIEKFSDSQTSYIDQHPGNPDEEELYRGELSAKAGNRLKTMEFHSGIGRLEKIPAPVSMDITMPGICIIFFKIISALEGGIPFSTVLFGKITLAPLHVVTASKPICF